MVMAYHLAGTGYYGATQTTKPYSILWCSLGRAYTTHSKVGWHGVASHPTAKNTDTSATPGQAKNHPNLQSGRVMALWI